MKAALLSTVPVLIGRDWYYLPADLIIRIEGDGNYSRIYTVGGRAYLTPKTLCHYEALLAGFWRINKGHLINPVFVTGSVGGLRRTNQLSLNTGDVLPVSRRRRGEVCRLIQRFQA